jgi:hypothetical protein
MIIKNILLIVSVLMSIPIMANAQSQDVTEIEYLKPIDGDNRDLYTYDILLKEGVFPDGNVTLYWTFYSNESKKDLSIYKNSSKYDGGSIIITMKIPPETEPFIGPIEAILMINKKSYHIPAPNITATLRQDVDTNNKKFTFRFKAFEKYNISIRQKIKGSIKLIDKFTYDTPPKEVIRKLDWDKTMTDVSVEYIPLVFVA